MQVALLGVPRRHRRDGEVVGEDVVDLAPLHRRRHRPVRVAADAVGARDGVVAGVLVVVDEQVPRVAVAPPPGRRHQVGCPPLHLARERQRRPADVLEAPSRLDPDIDVQTLAAAGLRPAGGAELVEHLVGDVGDPAHSREVALRHRVKIDPPLVGLLGVGPTAVPGVELDRGHLHRPDDAGQLGHAQLVGRPVEPREEEPHRLDPRRGSRRQPLLVHLLALDARREPVQHAGPLTQRVDDAVTDGQVVADQVELGRARRREVDPVRVGDPHVAVADLHLDGRRPRCARWHVTNLGPAPRRSRSGLLLATAVRREGVERHHEHRDVRQ